jgi:hypothetical protein
MKKNTNKKDQRNSLLGLLLVAGVVFYIYKTRKPKAYAIENTEGGGGGGGGGGFFGGGMPLIITTPAAAPAPVQPNCNVNEKYNETTKKCEPIVTRPTCKTGERYNPATRKCEPIPLDKPAEQTAKDAMNKAQTGGGLSAYDPCKDNGYGGTYDAKTNSCLKSPFCGGNDLLLDNNGKMKGCKADIPSGSGTGGVVGGVVGFSGKEPLTLDNLLC